MRKRRNTLAATLVLGAALAGCGSQEPATRSASRAATIEVEVVNIAYAPSTIEIERGSEVVWTNRDANVHHTVTSGEPGEDAVPGVSEGGPAAADGVFDGDLPDASEFSYTFEEAGTYNYFCRVHPSMTGKVVVK